MPQILSLSLEDLDLKKVFLGNTGIEVSIAGFGVLPIGPSQLALPVEEGAKIIKYALERGINFLDTAQYYRTYPYIEKAFEMIALEQEKHRNPKNIETKENGRNDKTPKNPTTSFSLDDIVICSKSLCWDYEGMMEAIKEAQAALHRDVIDIFLMHEVRSGQIELRAGAWQALKDAKAAGLVRAIGLSTHHVDVTMEAASMAELDVVFPLINYASLGIRKGDEFATKEEMMNAIRACHKAGKGIFSMKTFGGGGLTGHYQEALDYVYSKPEIDSVMIGFGKTKDVDDLISYLDGSMSDSYNPDISKKKVYINQEDCEGCGACKEACPAGAIFYNDTGLAEVDHSKCLTCGYCSPVCPVRAVIMY